MNPKPFFKFTDNFDDLSEVEAQQEEGNVVAIKFIDEELGKAVYHHYNKQTAIEFAYAVLTCALTLEG